MLSSDIHALLSDIDQHIRGYKSAKKQLFVTSSFQTHSIPLLHIIASLDASIPVYFLDTGFHFPETLDFRDQVADLLNIQVIPLKSPITKFNQRDANGRFLFCANADYCCHINKVLPLEPVLAEKDIWITGVRRDQNANRKQMGYEAQGPFNTRRYHPMLEWTSKMIWEYRKEYDLPAHPLEKEGYLSVGCEPCTQKYLEDDERSGRWAGQRKNECGLHTELIK